MNRSTVFLAAYRRTGSVTHAARAARMNKSMHYTRLKKDKAYALAFAACHDEVLGLLEDEAMRRGVEGIPRPLTWQGQITYQQDKKGEIVIDKKTKEPVPVTILEYSDPVLMFLMRGKAPEKYRERYQVQHSGQMGVQFEGTLVELLAVYQQLTIAEKEHAAAEQQPAKTRRPRD